MWTRASINFRRLEHPECANHIFVFLMPIGISEIHEQQKVLHREPEPEAHDHRQLDIDCVTALHGVAKEIQSERLAIVHTETLEEFIRGHRSWSPRHKSKG